MLEIGGTEAWAKSDQRMLQLRLIDVKACTMLKLARIDITLHAFQMVYIIDNQYDSQQSTEQIVKVAKGIRNEGRCATSLH